MAGTEPTVIKRGHSLINVLQAFPYQSPFVGESTICNQRVQQLQLGMFVQCVKLIPATRNNNVVEKRRAPAIMLVAYLLKLT
jgi:hypothetical protein